MPPTGGRLCAPVTYAWETILRARNRFARCDDRRGTCFFGKRRNPAFHPSGRAISSEQSWRNVPARSQAGAFKSPSTIDETRSTWVRGTHDRHKLVNRHNRDRNVDCPSRSYVRSNVSRATSQTCLRHADSLASREIYTVTRRQNKPAEWRASVFREDPLPARRAPPCLPSGAVDAHREFRTRSLAEDARAATHCVIGSLAPRSRSALANTSRRFFQNWRLYSATTERTREREGERK